MDSYGFNASLTYYWTPGFAVKEVVFVWEVKPVKKHKQNCFTHRRSTEMQQADDSLNRDAS